MVARERSVRSGRSCGKYARSAGVTQIRPGRRLGVHWPNSVHERALSLGELFRQAENRAEKRRYRSDKTLDETVRIPGPSFGSVTTTSQVSRSCDPRWGTLYAGP
jgi:hypothetical protein